MLEVTWYASNDSNYYDMNFERKWNKHSKTKQTTFYMVFAATGSMRHELLLTNHLIPKPKAWPAANQPPDTQTRSMTCC